MYLVRVFWDIANTLKDASFYNANQTFLLLLYAKRFSGENCAKGKKVTHDNGSEIILSCMNYYLKRHQILYPCVCETREGT